LEATKEVFLQEGFQKATITQMINKVVFGVCSFWGERVSAHVLMEDVMD